MTAKIYSTAAGDKIVDILGAELKDAKLYRRSTGHFSSTFLISAAEILVDFFDKNGKIEIICSAEINNQDFQTMQKADKEKIIEEIILNELDSFEERAKYLKNTHLKAFEELVLSGKIQFRIVVPKEGGIYHEKYGLIYKDTGNLSFSGGANMSRSAHESNSEMMTLYVDDKDSFEKLENTFLLVWNDRSDTNNVFTFSEACEKKILRIINSEKGKRNDDFENTSEQLKPKLRKHQMNAFNAFFPKCNGIIQMATGTGKTWVALAIAQELFSRKDVRICVIVASREPLLNQWEKDIINYFPEQYVLKRYGKDNQLQYLDSLIKEEADVIILTSYNLLDQVEKYIRKYSNVLLMCDEVHNLGSESICSKMRGKLAKIRYRLGLSATPERMFDEIGTDFICQEIGDIIYQYPLKEAISDGILCQFDYIPLRYELDAEEKTKLSGYYIQLFVAEKEENHINLEDIYRKIADVYKGSKNKYEPFKKFIKSRPEILDRCVIFVPTKEYGEEVKAIVYEISRHFHTFYEGDALKYLKDFSERRLNCLITCERISEGIDIANINNVILFSAARSDTETLQRIGRCLRKDPTNPEKIANIVDFVIEERIKEDGTTDATRYGMLTDLCRKVIE